MTHLPDYTSQNPQSESGPCNECQAPEANVRCGICDGCNGGVCHGSEHAIQHSCNRAMGIKDPYEPQAVSDPAGLRPTTINDPIPSCEECGMPETNVRCGQCDGCTGQICHGSKHGIQHGYNRRMGIADPYLHDAGAEIDPSPPAPQQFSPDAKTYDVTQGPSAPYIYTAEEDPEVEDWELPMSEEQGADD